MLFIDPCGMDTTANGNYIGADGLTDSQWLEASRPGASQGLAKYYRQQNNQFTSQQYQSKGHAEVGALLPGNWDSSDPSGQGVSDVSQAGLNFIAGYEGYSAITYKDVAGLPTIGYGHLIKLGESFGTLSKDAALKLLRKDASFAINAVNKYVTVSLTQNQFDALTSLTFNIGAGAFSNSTVLKNVNSGNILSIDKSFMIWNKIRIDGVLTPVQGLTNRRKAETNLFLNGDY